MNRSDLNHIRRLVAWVRCEIGQSPAELVATMRGIADELGHPPISDEARQRLVDSHDKAASVPKYVRAAVKALEKALGEPGAVVNAEAKTCEIAQVRKLPRSTP